LGHYGDTETSDSHTTAVQGDSALFDEEGFLLDPDVWNETIAENIARSQGMSELNELHWQVIGFLRKYYMSMGKAPLNTELRKGAGLSLTQIERIFPGGIKFGARRIAGLPNPKSC
jgi:dissimilatory sulfite reductase related protein